MCVQIPPAIDLIEILYANGEMTLEFAYLQIGGRYIAWRVLPSLIQSKAAALWRQDRSGARRRLADWEIAALARVHLNASLEQVPPEAELILCAAEATTEAYHRDFGSWYEEKLLPGK